MRSRVSTEQWRMIGEKEMLEGKREEAWVVTEVAAVGFLAVEEKFK